MATDGTIHRTLPCWHIPFLKNKLFVGRKTTLEVLKNIFFTQESQRAVVVGSGGVGKTQIALKFAYWLKETAPEYSIFWVSAYSNASFEQDYSEIATKLRVYTEHEDLKETVRRYLSSETTGPWLLIVDNADDKDILFGCPDGGDGIYQHLPQSEKGLTLYTTRSRKVAQAVARFDTIKLQEMNKDEAMEYLKVSFYRELTPQDESIAEELLRQLIYLPLAITQAVAYLNAKRVPIADYLRLLQGTEGDTIVALISKQCRTESRYEGRHNAIATTTWLVSFDQICKTDSVAAELLWFISRIEPKAIPQTLLPPKQSHQQMIDAIGTLESYALITRRGDSMQFDMHSLVHLATRVWVRHYNILPKVAEDAIRHLAKIFPSNDYANHLLWGLYLPHALGILHEQEGSEMRERYDLCFQVGQCLYMDGQIEDAVRWLRVAFMWCESHFPDNHPTRLASQHELAMVYQADGQIKKAIELLENIVTVRQTALAEDHPDWLGLQHELAQAYRADGQNIKAIDLLEYIVTIRETALAEDHPDRLESQYILARAYRVYGQIKEAVDLLEHIVAVQKIALAEDHPDRLKSQHELSRAYRADGQIKKAIDLSEYIVAVQKTALADDNSYRLRLQHELARAYQADGQIKKAIELLEQVILVQETALADNHLYRLELQHELAKAYQADGQIKKAIELLKHIVIVREITLAEDHPDRLQLQYELAVAYQADGQFKKAIGLLKHYIAVHETVLDDDDSDQFILQHELAVAYRADGQIKEAVELLEHVVAVQETVLDDDDPDRLASQRELAVAYRANGQIKEAVELLEHIVAVQETVLDDDDPDRLASQQELAVAYRADGQIKEADKTVKIEGPVKDAIAESNLLRLRDSYQASLTNRSYAASVFSRALSEETALSKTSWENVGSAKNEIVSFFLADAELVLLFTAAVKDPAIGGDRLERNFRRLLVEYSAELLASTKDKLHREAAKLVRSSAAFVAGNVRQHFEPKSPGYSSVSVPKFETEDERVGKRQMLNQFLEGLDKPESESEAGMEVKSSDGLDTKTELKRAEPDRLSETPSESASDEVSIMTALDQVKEFLSSGPPLSNLKTAMTNFVTPRPKPPEEQGPDKFRIPPSETEAPQTASGPGVSIHRVPMKAFPASLPDFVDYLFDVLPLPSHEPPVPPGKSRVRWKCKCGANLYDDFTELEPGSLRGLEAELRTANGDDSQPGRQHTWSLTRSYSALRNQMKRIIKSMRRGSTNNDIPLPFRNDSHQASSLGTPNIEILHLLCCIPSGEIGTTLHQEPISLVSTDRELILFLNETYRKRRGIMAWFRLRHVSKLLLTRFELDYSNYVQVHLHVACDPKPENCVCLPTAGHIEDYRCKPAPKEKLANAPVFGDNYLNHFFQNPQCIKEGQTKIFDQVPKYAKGHLVAKHDVFAMGWGVYFDEGWHWRSIYFIILVFVITGSLVFGVCWSVLEADIQSAFAITGYWMSLGSLLLGYMAVRGS